MVTRHNKSSDWILGAPKVSAYHTSDRTNQCILGEHENAARYHVNYEQLRKLFDACTYHALAYQSGYSDHAESRNSTRRSFIA
jgi:hypothetical protein